MRLPTVFFAVLMTMMLCRATASNILSDLVYKAIDQRIAKEMDDKVKRLDKLEKRLNEIEARLATVEKEDVLQNANLKDLQGKFIANIQDCPKLGKSGKYVLTRGNSNMEVYCDTQTDGGGWLVFQRRSNGKLNYDRSWKNYVNGFGNLKNEFWLGLDKLYRIQESGKYELRVELQDWEENSVYAQYSTFSIGNEEDKYKLTISGYSGTAGNSFLTHEGMEFSTKDKDNDRSANSNCAKSLKGGWWFGNCNLSHLNGKYYVGGFYSPKNDSSPIDGVSWYYWKNTKLYSMKTTEMKIRKKN